MQTLYILQGVPGSGKSELAKMIHCRLVVKANVPNGCVICSTDNYHKVDGEYKFQPEKLGDFHAANLADATNAMKRGATVIVDNTNIHRAHVKPYVLVAVELNIPVVFIRVTGNFKNIHGVPDHAIESMKARMETLDLDSVLAS